jgi:hypothetical protein
MKSASISEKILATRQILLPNSTTNQMPDKNCGRKVLDEKFYEMSKLTTAIVTIRFNNDKFLQL